MNDPSPNCNRPTSPGTTQVHLFAGIGGWPLALRIGGWPDDGASAGPGAAPVSRSQSPALGPEQTTFDIFGQKCTDLSASVVLQRCLENRLVSALDIDGSPEYELTWKRQAMPSGPGLCLLRASARLTPAIDCSGPASGWPTPMAGTPAQKGYNEAGDTCNSRKTKQLVGWPTPHPPNGGRKVALEHMRGGTAISPKTGNKMQLGLESVAGWAMPRSVETGHSTGNPERAHDRKSRIEDQVHLFGWATPAARDHKSGKASDEVYEKNARQLNEQVTRLTPTGWPTPQSRDGNKSRGGLESRTGGKRRNLDDYVTLAGGWPTPKSSDSDKGIRTPEGAAKERARQADRTRPASSGAWDDAVWLPCKDGVLRRTGKRIHWLAYGVSGIMAGNGSRETEELNHATNAAPRPDQELSIMRAQADSKALHNRQTGGSRRVSADESTAIRSAWRRGKKG